jgi:hypothetical protein
MILYLQLNRGMGTLESGKGCEPRPPALSVSLPRFRYRTEIADLSLLFLILNAVPEHVPLQML